MGKPTSQQTQNICITSVQRRPDIVLMLYKCFVFDVTLSTQKHHTRL